MDGRRLEKIRFSEEIASNFKDKKKEEKGLERERYRFFFFRERERRVMREGRRFF